MITWTAETLSSSSDCGLLVVRDKSPPHPTEYDDDNGNSSGSAYVYDLGLNICPADFNSDGIVNTRNVIAFLIAWSAGNTTADFNEDGIMNTQDVIAFLIAWSAGNTAADFNEDGIIDTRDMLTFLNAWVLGC